MTRVVLTARKQERLDAAVASSGGDEYVLLVDGGVTLTGGSE